MSSPNLPQPAFRFSLCAGALAVTVLVLLFGTFVAVVRRTNEDRLDRTIRNNFKRIYLGLHNYSSTWREMPPANRADANGALLSSWRFNIWPFIESSDTPRDLKSVWNSPSNVLAQRLQNDVFCWDESSSSLNTFVFAITGPGTAFSNGNQIDIANLPDDLAILMEVADSKTHWMQPGDYDVATLLAANGRIGDHLHGLLPDRLHVLFADGYAWTLSPEAPMTALHPFLTIAGAESHDRNALLAPHRLR